MPLENTGNVTIKEVKRTKKGIFLILSNDQEIEINDDIILDFYLFKDKELSESVIKEIKKSANMQNTLKKAYAMLGRGTYTKNEIKRKLLQKKCPPTVVDQVIAKLLSLHYIDDDLYVEEYVSNAKEKGFGPNKIKSNLIAKGISEQRLANISYNEKEELDVIKREIPKLERKYANYNYQSKLQHIYDKLLSLGFNKEIIQTALSNIEEKNDDKERELLKRDLLKAKNKYAKIIDKYERNKRIISYLYKKGYSYYIISDELKDDENEN